MPGVTSEIPTFDGAALAHLLDGRYGAVDAPTRTRECAGALVDAFAIPDEVVGAPIGLGDASAAQR